MHQRVDLPEAEVSGDKQDTAPMRMRTSHPIFAFEFDVREHLARRQRAELQQHHQQLTEVLEHPPRDHAALLPRLQREGRLKVVDREAPMTAVERVECSAEHRPRGQDAAHRQQPKHADDGGYSEVFETMAQGNVLVSQ